MSNARSPRDVCSTTIGTSGLMVLGSVRRAGVGSSRPGCRAYQRAGARVRVWRARAKGLRTGRPELARCGLSGRLVGVLRGLLGRQLDRLRLLGQELGRAAVGEV